MPPLEGLSFCCTGIISTVRDDIARKINALGGIHYSDLMSDVQYLIVGERSTAKYDYCVRKRADIGFLSQDAISSLYTRWTNGEKDLDIRSYTKAVFDQINVCMARIELDISALRELFQRDQFRLRALKHISQPTIQEYFNPANLAKVIRDNGGKVTDSLTMSNTCVVSTEMSGRRYEKAIEWKINVVHPVWIFDSMVRGALLDPSDYVVGSKNFNKGCEVWDDLFQESTVKKRPDEGPRRRTDNESNIWSSIMEVRAHKKRSVQPSVWDDDDITEENTEYIEEKIKEKQPACPDYFRNLSFEILGFSDKHRKVLESILIKNSGKVGSDSFTHVVVPASKGAQVEQILSQLPSTEGITVVTEFFVERTMYYKRLLVDRWGFPMRGLVPSQKRFKVCLSGFSGVELLHLEKLVQYLNLELCETLSSHRDLLVVNINLFKSVLVKSSPQLFSHNSDIIDCPTLHGPSVSTISTKNKINAAKNWGIPIVSFAYLWEAIEMSVGKSVLIMPEIADLRWCLFAPSTKKPGTLFEYSSQPNAEKTNHIDSFQSKENTPENKHIDSFPVKNDTAERNCIDSFQGKDCTSERKRPEIRLPSPRKLKAKRQKYGRLTGSKQDESSSEMGEKEDEANITLEEDSIQVQYQDPESARRDRELLEKLENNPRRRRGRASMVTGDNAL